MNESGFDYWDFFVTETRRNPAPLYEQLAKGISQDEELKAFANDVRPGQPPANILFAAVHFLLLRGAEHPLRRFYANLNGGTRAENLVDAFPAFRDFVIRHRDELAPLVRTRVTNTNEVARSTVLHAGFRAVAGEAGEPLHLIEIGPSAGLNLLWDRYRVRYVRGGQSIFAGLEESPLVLETELRGDSLPPAGRNPQVASRVGLERNPVDLSDADDRDWLRALVWPDQIARFARLETALRMSAGENLPIRRGDALALLPEVLSELPHDQTICVYHSFVTYQFSDESRAALNDLLIAASLRRAVWRLSWEGTFSGEAPLLLYSYRDGARDKRLLAYCQPHGAWLNWQA